MIIISAFGKILRELRNSNNLTQIRLADALGLASPSTISMYESGEREPDFETMEAIADFFNVTMDYLHGKTEDTALNPNSYPVLYYHDETKSPFENSKPFIATNREMKVIMEYRAKTETQNAINKIINQENPTAITNDEALMFALYGEDDQDITPEMLNEVREFAQFVKEKRKKANDLNHPI